MKLLRNASVHCSSWKHGHDFRTLFSLSLQQWRSVCPCMNSSKIIKADQFYPPSASPSLRWNLVGSPSYVRDTHVYVHAQCTLFLPDFDQNFKVSTYFSKASQYQISLKFVQRDITFRQTTKREGESNSGMLANFHFEMLYYHFRRKM